MREGGQVLVTFDLGGVVVLEGTVVDLLGSRPFFVAVPGGFLAAAGVVRD